MLFEDAVMEEEDPPTKKSAKNELEEAFVAALEKIKKSDSEEEPKLDLHKIDSDEELMSDLDKKESEEVSVSDLKEEESSEEVLTSVTHKEKLGEASISDLKGEELVEAPISDLQETYSIELLVSKLDAKIDEFVESTKNDLHFCYDELAKFHDAITKIKSDFTTLADKMNKIDEKFNESLTEQEYEHDDGIVKAKIIEFDEPTLPAKTKLADTSEITSSSTEELTSIAPIDAEKELKSIEHQRNRRKVSFEKIAERLTAVGLIRVGSEPFYIVCEILAKHDLQEMNYDTLFIKSNLHPQTFSQIIFDLASKKIIDFDGRTEKVRFWTPT